MVEWLAGHGVTEVVLACGFLPDVLREALGDGEHDGTRLTYVTEPDRRGRTEVVLQSVGHPIDVHVTRFPARPSDDDDAIVGSGMQPFGGNFADSVSRRRSSDHVSSFFLGFDPLQDGTCIRRPVVRACM